MALMQDTIIISDQEEMRTAHLDVAHVGDIKGAWGAIRLGDSAPRKTWRAWLMTLLIIMGPGLITMIGDNDAGGISTYIQAGQNYGTSLLWALLILIPVLIVNQEMVVRLGAVTGVGHARLIFERFGKFWGAFSVIDLFLLNFMTIISEFIGFSLGLQYFGVSPLISVPLAVIGLTAITATGSFRRWERVMWICCAISLMMISLIFCRTRSWEQCSLIPLFRPFGEGSIRLPCSTIIAIVGTTVAPWQLFFQQSNIIDKRITPRWLNAERIDTTIGAFITNIEAAGLIIVAAVFFAGTKFDGNFVEIITSARGFAALGHPIIGAILAIILINASVVGACAVTLSTSYAFGDVFKVRHSLHRKVNEAKFFYGSYGVMVLLGGAIVLIPNAPLGLITLAVQALAGILLPSATVFLVLLCNDRAVLGPWVNALLAQHGSSRHCWSLGGSLVDLGSNDPVHLHGCSG